VHLLAKYLHYPVAILGTIIAFVLAWIIKAVGDRYIDHRYTDAKEHYSKRTLLSTLLTLAVAVTVIILWARLFEQRGTFFGLVGAGVAVALKEPLLSIAGRLAIFAGHMYSVGDRIELDKMKGDVVHIGFFYTRMMEIGNWIHGDQASGRLLQFSNSQVFGKAVFNYTQDFSYIWDEVCLPITYGSNLSATTRILTEVGAQYTQDFLKGAQVEMERMQRAFLVPKFELDPQVYVKITSNWLELAMRYVVEPKKRRSASSFIYTEVFKRVQERDDIQIASETMDLTVRQPQEQPPTAESEERAA
jgi:small-conductance mechanosensitive channel